MIYVLRIYNLCFDPCKCPCANLFFFSTSFGTVKASGDSNSEIRLARPSLAFRQASRASSCTSFWAWMGSTRLVALRRAPLRRPSSKHEARAPRRVLAVSFCRHDCKTFSRLHYPVSDIMSYPTHAELLYVRSIYFLGRYCIATHQIRNSVIIIDNSHARL